MMTIPKTIILLALSNIFMNFAWYAHLKEMNTKPWLYAVFFSWGIALVEYLFQVPANRIGYTQLSVSQLKILQEILSLTLFMPFAFYFMKEKITWNYGAALVCMLAAVFFMFYKK